MPPPDGRANDTARIGQWHGVQIEIAPHDAVSVDVAVAIAGVFRHEVARDAPVGGLGHLDAALGGAITRLRADGIFGARLGEILTLSAPAPPIRASTVLAVGLGDPELWTPAALCEAVASAAREALRIDAVSVAFAPSLLDSGLSPERLVGVPEAMLRGLFDALANGRPAPLLQWVFCAGVAHFEATTAAFAKAYAELVARPETDPTLP